MIYNYHNKKTYNNFKKEGFIMKTYELFQMAAWIHTDEFEKLEKDDKYIFITQLEYHIIEKMKDKRISTETYTRLLHLQADVHHETFNYNMSVNCEKKNSFKCVKFYQLNHKN